MNIIISQGLQFKKKSVSLQCFLALVGTLLTVLSPVQALPFSTLAELQKVKEVDFPDMATLSKPFVKDPHPLGTQRLLRLDPKAQERYATPVRRASGRLVPVFLKEYALSAPHLQLEVFATYKAFQMAQLTWDTYLLQPQDFNASTLYIKVQPFPIDLVQNDLFSKTPSVFPFLSEEPLRIDLRIPSQEMDFQEAYLRGYQKIGKSYLCHFTCFPPPPEDTSDSDSDSEEEEGISLSLTFSPLSSDALDDEGGSLNAS